MTWGPLLPVLVVHVVAGFVAMLGGLVPALVRKGGAGHRRWGQAFTWAMLGVAVTTIPLAVATRDPFQVALGLLAAYAAQLGRRTGHPAPPTTRDAVVSLLGAFAFALLTVGSFFWSFAGDRATARLALLFGAMGFALAARDLAAIVLRDHHVSRRIVDHVLATTLALCVAWGSFLNTQLLRLTGARWPLDAKLALPMLVALPLLVYWLPRWSTRLREQGARAWTGGHEPLEVERLHALGIAEGVSLLLLLFVAVPLKRLGGEATLVRVLGPIHGALFVLYSTSALIAARSLGWSWRRTFLTLAAACVPFGTFLWKPEVYRKVAKP